MAIYPFNLTTMEGGPREQQMIAASLADWDKAGTSAWCGYSFSWMACLRARVGDAEAALRNFQAYGAGAADEVQQTLALITYIAKAATA